MRAAQSAGVEPKIVFRKTSKPYPRRNPSTSGASHLAPATNPETAGRSLPAFFRALKRELIFGLTAGNLPFGQTATFGSASQARIREDFEGLPPPANPPAEGRRKSCPRDQTGTGREAIPGLFRCQIRSPRRFAPRDDEEWLPPLPSPGELRSPVSPAGRGKMGQTSRRSASFPSRSSIIRSAFSKSTSSTLFAPLVNSSSIPSWIAPRRCASA